MSRPDYIFILGMDRTGSTLIREILNCSDEIALAGEAQYFRRRPHWSLLPDHGHRGLFKKFADISKDDGAKSFIDCLFRDPEYFSDFWRFSLNGFDREEFLSSFLKTNRSEQALLDLALTFHAKGKRIRGEKTPANIFFVPIIMKWFPNAKLIHTFRDPRAIYVSRRNKKEKGSMPRLNKMIRKTGIIFEFYASNRVIFDWQQTIRFHRRYQEAYPGKYYLLKYEELIRDPENAIHNLCTFLDVNFHPKMLQQQVVNSSFVPRDQLRPGFDNSAIDRWRKHIHPLVNRWITFCCKSQLLEYGYQP
jgi:hypothetical protein